MISREEKGAERLRLVSREREKGIGRKEKEAVINRGWKKERRMGRC